MQEFDTIFDYASKEVPKLKLINIKSFKVNMESVFTRQIISPKQSFRNIGEQ